jgi:hypothetical protein
MLRIVLTRILAFAGVTTFAFALLMVDTESPSLVSEAQACDWNEYQSCMVGCGTACWWGLVAECKWEEPDVCCPTYCDDWCRSYWGC